MVNYLSIIAKAYMQRSRSGIVLVILRQTKMSTVITVQNCAQEGMVTIEKL